MKPRVIKKTTRINLDLDRLAIWYVDYRGALIEAMHENIDLRIIDYQFKRQMKRNRPKNRYFKATKMVHYRKVALG